MGYKYPTKRYFHIDPILSYTDEVKSYVENPECISRHGFLPFLKYTISCTKFVGHNKNVAEKRKTKDRPIMFASHIDSFIYSHYGTVISEKYNEWTSSHNIDECSIAYRNNKKGKSNIQFAAEVIKEIIQCGKCYIFVGDFSKFFENIEHRQLKRCLKDVLQVSELPRDYYQVLKSLMKFSYVDLKKLRIWLTAQKINYEKNKRYFLEAKDFRAFKTSTKLVQKNIDMVGIPQGSAMSGLLANIYMIHADEAINRIVQAYNGLYRRYSDDFIVVIPYHNVSSTTVFKDIIEEIIDVCKNANVMLHQDKTNKYLYEEGSIKSFDLDKGIDSALTYLGFRFDGKNVMVRQSCVYKFYREARDVIQLAKRRSENKNTKVLLYQPLINRLFMDTGSKTYWDKKRKRIKYGNFISYMIRSQKEFEKIDGITCQISEQIKHRRKIIQQYIHAKQTLKTKKEKS